MPKRVKYVGKMDPECMPLCDALNSLPGIHTFESCCGHGKDPFRVFFKARSLKGLMPIIEAASTYYWKIQIQYGSVGKKIYYTLESPKPDSNWQKEFIYEESIRIVEFIKELAK